MTCQDIQLEHCVKGIGNMIKLIVPWFVYFKTTIIIQEESCRTNDFNNQVSNFVFSVWPLVIIIQFIACKVQILGNSLLVIPNCALMMTKWNSFIEKNIMRWSSKVMSNNKLIFNKCQCPIQPSQFHKRPKLIPILNQLFAIIMKHFQIHVYGFAIQD